MIKLGVTGGIASGKSVVASVFRTMGVPVYFTDDRAKELMVIDSGVKTDLINLLGEDAYLPNGTLNKKKIADFLFANKENANLINQIVHPRVKSDFMRWASMHEENNEPLVVMECAILIEANFLDAVDKSILVYAPLDVRINRAIARDNSTKELIEQRIKAQFPEEEKIARVDYVIHNDGNHLLLPQIMQILDQL